MKYLKKTVDFLVEHKNTVSLIIGVALWHHDKELARYFIS